MLKQGHTGQEDSIAEEKYAIIHNMMRSTGVDFENTFSLQFTWQERQIFEKITWNVYSSPPKRWKIAEKWEVKRVFVNNKWSPKGIYV